MVAEGARPLHLICSFACEAFCKIESEAGGAEVERGRLLPVL